MALFNWENNLLEQRAKQLSKMPQYGDTDPRSVFDKPKGQGYQPITMPRQFEGGLAQPEIPLRGTLPATQTVPFPQAIAENIADPSQQPAPMPDIFAQPIQQAPPQQAPQAQPQSVAGAVDARMTAPTQPESQYPRIAEGTEFSDLRIKGYTDEENRRFNQEANIGNAKKGIGERIAAKELAKSLEAQGLSRDEINKAIGGNTAETLGNLKAMQAGRSPSAKGRMVNSRARDNAVQGAVMNEDGTPKNREARVVGYMDWADGTGNDPEGKSRKDMMSPGQWNQFDRDTKTLSRGKNEQLEKKLVNTMKQVDAKIERAYNKKIAERTTKELGIAQAKLGLAISAEQRQADRNQIDSWKTELEQLDEIDVPLLGGGDKKKEIAARKQQIFENITEFNKSKEGAPELMSKDDFVSDFESEEGRKPTTKETESLKGKAWG